MGLTLAVRVSATILMLTMCKPCDLLRDGGSLRSISGYHRFYDTWVRIWTP